MSVLKSAATKNAQKEKARLQALKESLSADYEKIKYIASTEKKAKLKQEISNIDAKIEQLDRDTYSIATPYSQHTKTAATPTGAGDKSTPEEFANGLIDAAFRVFGTIKERDFVKLEGKEKIIPLIGGVAGIDVGIQGGIKIEATAERYNRGLKVKGTLKGSIEPNIGLGVGIDLGFLGTYKLAGGIQGGAAAEASIGFMLDVYRSSLRASVNPFDMKIEMVAKLYLVIPFISEDFIGYAKALHSSIDADGNRLTYQIGSIEIFTVTTPTYSLNFDLKKGKFSYASTPGDITVTVNQEVKDSVNSMISSVKEAVREVGDALNPVRQAEKIISWVDSLL